MEPQNRAWLGLTLGLCLFLPAVRAQAIVIDPTPLPLQDSLFLPSDSQVLEGFTSDDSEEPDAQDIVVDIIDGPDNTVEIFTFSSGQEVVTDPVPDSILDFVENYPQAISFALNYNRFRNNTSPISIEPDLVPGEIPLFIQWDPRWGYQTYGSDFMGITGCGPTCLSMVICGLTGSTVWNPYEVARWSYNNGYYVYGQGTAWSLMESGSASFGLTAYSLNPDETSVLTALSAGRPIICSVGPGDFTHFGHFILLRGRDSAGNVYINDPNSPPNSLRAWPLSQVLPQVKAMWSFTVTNG